MIVTLKERQAKFQVGASKEQHTIGPSTTPLEHQCCLPFPINTEVPLLKGDTEEGIALAMIKRQVYYLNLGID